MKRRSFLAGLFALPLAKLLPAPKPAPVPKLEPWQDQTSIWLISWGDNHVYAAARRPGKSGLAFTYMGVPLRRTNWLKKELNK